MAAFLSEFDGLYKALRSDDGDENSTDTSTASVCVSDINHQMFHTYLLIPSVITSLIMAFMMKRRHRWLDVLQGRPGIIFPMDLLGRSNRFSYAAAWGSIAYLASDVIFERKYAVNFEAPTYVKVFLALLSMLIYGIDYFPLFAALAQHSLVGCIIGTAYAWMFFGIEIFLLTECNLETESRVILVFRDLPRILCLGYLSLSIPARLVQLVRLRNNLLYASERVAMLNIKKELSASIEGIHCTKLFKPPPPPPAPPSSIKEKILAIVKQLARAWLYHPHSNFRYSSRMLSVMLIGVFLLYKTTFELVVPVVSLFYISELSVQQTLEVIGWAAEEGEDPLLTDARQAAYFFYYIIIAVRGCFLTSISLAFFIGLLMILHMLSSYRTNLFALYKGDYTHIPPREVKSNAGLLVGCMRYAGYQVGYIAWGYILQFGILFLVSVACAVVITLIQMGITGWLITIIQNAWPVVVVSLVINIMQLLAAKLVFLQDRGEVLAIDNRRILFCASFFMFFYNIFLGFISCLLRIVKAMVIGTVFMSRLDNSTLPRRFQMMDPGFDAYVGFIHVENAHTHPVLVVFLKLLMLTKQEKDLKDAPEKESNLIVEKKEKYTLCESRARVSGRARTRWFLLYTLFHNTHLRTMRKAHLQNMRLMQERLMKQYNLSHSAAGNLVKNVNQMVEQVGMADVDLNMEADPITGIPNSWGALLGMNKFMRNIQQEMARSQVHTGFAGLASDIAGQNGIGMKDLANGDSPSKPLTKWNRLRVAVNPNSQSTEESNALGADNPATSVPREDTKL